MSAWLAASYAVLALGLGWTLTTGSWKRRLPFIICAPALAVALWFGQPNPAGWPTSARVPAQAGFVWGVIDEPDPLTGDRGRIYLWLDVGARAPRAYSLPYTRQLHEQVQHAIDATRHGHVMTVARPVHSRHGSGTHGSARHGVKSVLRFYPHPPVLLPQKPR